MRASGHPVAGLVFLLAVVSVGACSDPIQPAKVAKASATPTATSTPSPTKLTPEQEVEAAVRAYYAELTRAAQTNDTSKLKKLVHKNCPCYRAIEVIDRNAEKRLRTPDADLKIATLHVHEVISGTAGVEVNYEAGAYAVVDEAGSTIDTVPARNDRVDLSLVKTDERWIVSNLFNLGAK